MPAWHSSLARRLRACKGHPATHGTHTRGAAARPFIEVRTRPQPSMYGVVNCPKQLTCGPSPHARTASAKEARSPRLLIVLLKHPIHRLVSEFNAQLASYWHLKPPLPRNYTSPLDQFR